MHVQVINNSLQGLQPPSPVAARSKAWVCARTHAGTAGSNPAGDVKACCILSGTSLCGELIIRPEEAY